MGTFEHYLKERYREATVKRYLRSKETLEQHLGTDAAASASYRMIMEHIGTLREQGLGNAHLTTELAGLKAFFKYLVRSGARVDDPTRNIFLKGAPGRVTQFQDLFSPDELELLLERPVRYEILKWRNKLIVSLLIYQAITTGELSRLTVHDVDLDNATVFIQASVKNCSRVLPLEAKQMLLFERYLTFDRPDLVKYDTDALFIGKLGKPTDKDGFQYLIESMRELFPSRKLNPTTIRQSVIVNLFSKGWDIRDIQLFAGHHYASTTERYQPTDLTALAEGLDKWHPLG